jgi:hypothetical protein
MSGSIPATSQVAGSIPATSQVVGSIPAASQAAGSIPATSQVAGWWQQRNFRQFNHALLHCSKCGRLQAHPPIITHAITMSRVIISISKNTSRKASGPTQLLKHNVATNINACMFVAIGRFHTRNGPKGRTVPKQ